MDPTLLPRQLLASIQAAPAAGVELLFSLADQSVVSVFDQVDPSGTTMMDALLDGALHGKLTHWTRKEDLFLALFSPANLDTWLRLSDGQAFCRRDQNGAWVPQVMLDRLETNRIASKASHAKPAPVKKKAAPWEGRKIDQWLARVLPSLPEDAWIAHGADWLSYALTHQLPLTTDQAWPRVSALAETSAGEPVLASARTGKHWDRFIEEGNDPNANCLGLPVWKFLLDRASRKPPLNEALFLGRFEAWFLEHAPSDASMRPHLKNLMFRRLASAAKTPPAHWIKLISAAGPESLHWVGSKKNAPLWSTICLAHPDAAMFDALEATPSLFKHIPRQDFEVARLAMRVNALRSAIGPVAQKEAFNAVLGHIDSRGWPSSGVGMVSLFADIALAKELRTQLRDRIATNPVAWWGPEEHREQLGLDLVKQLPSLGRSATRLDAWIDLVGDGDGAWFRVGRGLAGALRSRMDALEGLGEADVRVVFSSPEGRSLLLDMSKSVPPKLRPHYNAWLESACLVVSVPSAPSSPRRGMRL